LWGLEKRTKTGYRWGHNGTYLLQLRAEDTNGATATTQTQVDVYGELKLGNFQLSFTDLSIPVTGILITVTRTYDSLKSNQQDEMGYGWRLEFRDTDLKTSLSPTLQ
jgi:large repetitive protein